MKAAVFLGGGRITAALIAGLRRAKYEGTVVVHDRHPQKLRSLKRLYWIGTETDLATAVDQAGLLMIAVSLAAGVPLSKLRHALGSKVRWARAMPSPACRSGRGLTALTFERRMRPGDRRLIKGFFEKTGPVLEIPENKFDAFTTTYSCSHGYHALAALAAAGHAHGLDRRTALTAAAHALADGILAWRDGTVSLDNLLHEAATPGGIAAATMTAMDAAGYRKAVNRGLRAGIDLARKHGKR